MNDFDNEEKPLILFGMHSEEELGFNIETTKNEDDPPDYFAIVNDSKKINLEVTQLASSLFHKRSSFLNKIYEHVVESTEELKVELRPGFYFVNFELGETQTSNSWSFSDWSSKHSISNARLFKEIKNSLQKIMSNFNGNHSSEPILNKKNQQIGIIYLSLKNDNDKTEIFVYPQEISISQAEPSFIEEQIQKTIDSKEDLYKGIRNSQNEWWLLIHDIRNYLNVDLFHSKIESHQFKYNFFSKILLIRPKYAGYRISEL